MGTVPDTSLNEMRALSSTPKNAFASKDKCNLMVGATGGIERETAQVCAYFLAPPSSSSTRNIQVPSPIATTQSRGDAWSFMRGVTDRSAIKSVITESRDLDGAIRLAGYPGGDAVDSFSPFQGLELSLDFRSLTAIAEQQCAKLFLFNIGTPWVEIRSTGTIGTPPVRTPSSKCCSHLHLIRAFEEFGLDLLHESLVHGPWHFSIGQEGGAVGVMSLLEASDQIAGSHRGAPPIPGEDPSLCRP